MTEIRITVPDDLKAQVERVRVIYGDEKLSLAVRRILRAGVHELLKVEEGRQG